MDIDIEVWWRGLLSSLKDPGWVQSPDSKATDRAVWPHCLGVTVYSLSVEGHLSSGRSVVSIDRPMGFYLPVYLRLISLFTH